MTTLDLMNLLTEYRRWVVRQNYFRDKVEQDYDYDEELEEANANVDELEAELLRRLTIAEESQGFKPIDFISKGKGGDNERAH